MAAFVVENVVPALAAVAEFVLGSLVPILSVIFETIVGTLGNIEVAWQAVWGVVSSVFMEMCIRDSQETFDLAFGQAANILMREHVAPEGDAYTFAKICGLSGITDNTDSIENGAQFLEAILTATTDVYKRQPLEARWASLSGVPSSFP